MDLLLAQLFSVTRRMWKYRWYGVLVAWVTGAIGAIVVFSMPDRYEATARIYVDTQSILKPLMSGMAVSPNVEMQINMLSKTLISRPNVEKLVRMADLDLKNQTKAEQEALIDRVSSELKISSAGRDNLYTLAYRDRDPELAKRAVQSLVTIFVESSLGSSRKDSATASSFITDQIKNYEGKLEEAESRLKEFRLRNLQTMNADGKDSASRLAEMSGQLDRAKLELREATQARDAARAQLEGERTRGTNTTTQSLMQESALTVSTPELDARIDGLKRNLDALLQRFTEQHPDIVSARKLLKDLEEQKRKEVADLRKAAIAAQSVPNGQPSSLAQQELARMLASSEVLVAGLRARVDEYSSRYAQALAAVKTAPQLEAEFAQLNRDYSIHKKNYEDLVARRESASLSGELDVASGVADFKLIDPPRADPKPVAPNRLLLLAGVLAVCLVAGVFATFVGSQLRPVFHDAGELRLRTELPVLGVVSRLISDAEKRRVRVDLVRFGVASGGLVVVFAVGLSIMAILMSKQVG
ncbi:XrtA system polysaccharide chain length determinant [Paucibacter sp. JuS9]|uniref:XrtA system polysaccharide chain length determinant n=1 Tax=Paucibacter sp. JuS9 TaxID=3228748 RepID=UPI0037565905